MSLKQNNIYEESQKEAMEEQECFEANKHLKDCDNHKLEILKK